MKKLLAALVLLGLAAELSAAGAAAPTVSAAAMTT